MPFINTHSGFQVNTHSGSCRQACRDLQDKVAKRVAGWKARALSQAGRTVLIQAVASAMPSYFMAVFLLPKEVLRDIDRVFKNFWWGFKDDTQRHYHPEAWSAICVPQELGGLGLRRMEDINKALLAQLGWKFLTDENALWLKALNAKYCRSADFLSLSRRGSHSWTWSSLLHIQDIISAGLCWQIGNGGQLNIWCTPWVPGIEHFKPKLRMGILVDRAINYVKDLMLSTSLVWDAQLIRSIFEPPSAAAILDISLPSQPGVDCPKWIRDPSGVLSTKAAYKFIIQSRAVPSGGLSNDEWKSLWKIKIQHRLSRC